MNEQPFVKGAVDLFLDDVDRYLEETPPTAESPRICKSLWHAVLYLSRAVKAMREEKAEDRQAITLANTIIASAKSCLIELRGERGTALCEGIEEAIRILEGG